MARLGGVDASFLYLETPETPMHIAGLTLYDLPRNFSGTFYDHFRTFFEGRIHLIPIFSMKLASGPLGLDHPGWVDEPDLDLDYHLRREILPAPGTREQLEALTARMHSQLMDRTRPLWQFVVIEGLDDGRVALYSKVHHAAVDGGAGMIITKALYDVTEVPREVEPPQPKANPVLTRDLSTSVNDLVVGMVKQQQAALRAMPEMLSAFAKAVMPPAGKDAGLSDMFPNLLQQPKMPQLSAPRTPFNVSITSQRSYAARTASFSLAKKITKATGAKLNDVVLAVCGSALRTYLTSHNALPATSLLAGVPISLREAGNTDLNNQVSMMICPIGTDIATPLERLMAIRAASSDAKDVASSVKGAVPTDFTFIGAPMIMTGMMQMFSRLKAADWMMSPANVSISNTQGPPVPIYCAGAKVVALYPVSIATHGIALNITVQSYCDSLDFGLTADRKAVPDVDVIGDLLLVAMEELAVAAGVAAEKSQANQTVTDAAPGARTPKATRKAAPEARN